MGRWQLAAIHAQLLSTAMVWGSQFVALKVALRELRVTDMLLLRMLLAASFYAALLSALAWREGQPTQVSVYIYLVPVFGVFATALFLGDRLTAWTGLGGLTILARVIVTNLGARHAPLITSPLVVATSAPEPEVVAR